MITPYLTEDTTAGIVIEAVTQADWAPPAWRETQP